MTAKEMEAAVLHEFGKPLTIEEKTVPEPGPGEVLVKVKASELCISDLHIQDGLIKTVRLPYTPGHRTAGEIVTVGLGVTRIKIGDHITAVIDLVCGSCRYCLSGRTNLCRSLKRIGFERDGFHQEYCVIPEENAFPVADWAPFDQVTGLPDAMSYMYNTIRNRAQAGPGSRLLILGTGGLGMNAIQLAKIFSAEVYATSHQKARLGMVLEMGANEVIDTSCQDLEQGTGRLTGGEMCDMVIGNIGIKGSINQALKVTAPGGRVIVYGYQYPYFVADYRDVMRFGKEIVGLRRITRQDLREVIRLVESRKTAPFMYRTIPFEAINEGLQMLRTGTTEDWVVLKMEEWGLKDEKTYSNNWKWHDRERNWSHEHPCQE